MAITIIKETIELDSFTCDGDGNAFLQKRINLQAGMIHNLIQTDIFEDAFTAADGTAVRYEVVVSPYPVVPTNMPFIQTPAGTRYKNRYPSAGDDSVLFKVNGNLGDDQASSVNQFPSDQIAANQATSFYTDHLYINFHIMGAPDQAFTNFAWSFMFTMQNKSVASLVHSLGVLSESHDAMCAQLMSNGMARSIATLRGNVFPMWRYGGIRPEATIAPLAANSFFLPLSNRDAEEMITAPGIRTAVAGARQMNAFDGALGPKTPDWLREFLNAGLISGPIRSNPVPLRYADNGNTRMF